MGPTLDYPLKKYGGAFMLGKMARGTYVLVVGAMVVAWVISINQEIPADPQPTTQEVTYYVFA